MTFYLLLVKESSYYQMSGRRETSGRDQGLHAHGHTAHWAGCERRSGGADDSGSAHQWSHQATADARRGCSEPQYQHAQRVQPAGLLTDFVHRSAGSCPRSDSCGPQHTADNPAADRRIRHLEAGAGRAHRGLRCASSGSRIALSERRRACSAEHAGRDRVRAERSRSRSRLRTSAAAARPASAAVRGSYHRLPTAAITAAAAAATTTPTATTAATAAAAVRSAVRGVQRSVRPQPIHCRHDDHDAAADAPAAAVSTAVSAIAILSAAAAAAAFSH